MSKIDLGVSLSVANESIGKLAERAENDPSEAERLKFLLKTIVTRISGYQQPLPEIIEDYCDDPTEENWHYIDYRLSVLAETVVLVLDTLEAETGDLVIDDSGLFADLVGVMHSRGGLIYRIRINEFPHSPKEIQRLRVAADEYRTLIGILGQKQEELAGYIRKRRSQQRGSDANDTTEDVVLLVHGIRDFALWQSSVRSVLENHGITVESTNYGRLNLLRFLFPFDWFRRYAMRAVSSQIKMACFAHPGKRVSVIAHSFGTYLIASILRDEFDVRFHRIIFCGSVVPYDFPFENCATKFENPILNEVGTRDIWPAVAESVSPTFGSAGTYGFRRTFIRDRWHNGAGHGYFLASEFAEKFWIPYLSNGTIVDGASDPEKPSIPIQLLSIVKIKYVVLVACVLATGFFIWSLAQ